MAEIATKENPDHVQVTVEELTQILEAHIPKEARSPVMDRLLAGQVFQDFVEFPLPQHPNEDSFEAGWKEAGMVLWFILHRLSIFGDVDYERFLPLSGTEAITGVLDAT